MSIFEELNKKNSNINKIKNYIRNKGVDVLGYRNITPLFVACESGNFEIAKLLIENGANVNHEDSYKLTPLFVACESGYFEIAELLIKNKADVNHEDSYNKTPLFVACESSGYFEIAELLIKNKADVNHEDSYKSTPLFYVQTPEIAKLLIENKADVNHKNLNKQTPLFFVQTPEIAQLLIENGADVNHVNSKGKTPLDGYNSNSDVYQFLVQNHAKHSYELKTTLIISQNVLKQNTNTNSCNMKLYNFLLQEYTIHIVKIEFEGSTGINAGGLSRIVYEIFYKQYINKHFENHTVMKNTFSIPKFPFNDDMVKATDILVSLATKTNSLILLPFPNSLLFLLRQTTNQINRIFEPTQNTNQIKITNTNQIKITNVNHNKIGNTKINNFAKLKNTTKENIQGYVGLNEHKNNIINKEWKNFTPEEKSKYYFFNYLVKLGIKTIQNFKILQQWFQTIPGKLITNHISYDKESFMKRVNFKIDGTVIDMNQMEYQKAFPNAYLLFQYITDENDDNRIKFTEWLTGTKYSNVELKIFISKMIYSLPFYVHTCSNDIDVYLTTEKYNMEYFKTQIESDIGSKNVRNVRYVRN